MVAAADPRRPRRDVVGQAERLLLDSRRPRYREGERCRSAKARARQRLAARVAAEHDEGRRAARDAQLAAPPTATDVAHTFAADGRLCSLVVRGPRRLPPTARRLRRAERLGQHPSDPERCGEPRGEYGDGAAKSEVLYFVRSDHIEGEGVVTLRCRRGSCEVARGRPRVQPHLLPVVCNARRGGARRRWHWRSGDHCELEAVQRGCRRRLVRVGHGLVDSGQLVFSAFPP